jgi:glycosyltransferase-like protein
MRIALLTYSTRPRGGVVHTLALAEALAAGGDEVTVFSLGRGGDAGFFRPVDASVDVRIVPLPDVADETVGDRILRSIATLAPAVDRRAFDIVHAEDCISANAAPGSVRTVHHIDHFETPELVACHERALVEPVAHVCVSGAVADELAQGWGIKATVIPNGVDAARFAAAARPDAAGARQAWREQIGGPFVLAVGGIEPRKGSLDLVEAMAELPELAMVVAGGETLFDYRSYRAEFDRRADRLGVRPVILGPVAEEQLPALVATADVFAFPSTKEGFGMAALEAAAAGVPLVLRDLPVLREVFGAVPTWFGEAQGVSLAQALASALAQPPSPAAGRVLAASYTWTAAAAAHRRFYEAVLAE